MWIIDLSPVLVMILLFWVVSYELVLGEKFGRLILAMVSLVQDAILVVLLEMWNQPVIISLASWVILTSTMFFLYVMPRPAERIEEVDEEVSEITKEDGDDNEPVVVMDCWPPRLVVDNT